MNMLRAFCLLVLCASAAVPSDWCRATVKKDAELFVVLETNDPSGYPGVNREAFSSGIQKAAEWVEAQNREFAVSYGRATVNSALECYKQDLIRSDAQTLADTMMGDQSWLLEDTDNSLLASIVWARRFLWNEEASQTLRRLFVLLVALPPDQSSCVGLSLGEEAAEKLDNGCPLPAVPPQAQVSRAIKHTGAGVLLYHNPAAGSDVASFQLWEALFATMGIADRLLLHSQPGGTTIEADFTEALTTMLCPTPIGMLTTLSPNHDLIYCASVIDPCNINWQQEMTDCLEQRQQQD